MAINLTTKYEKELQQKFTAGSLVDGRLSNKVDFVGAKTVKVYTLTTVTPGDYFKRDGSSGQTATSANRYGIPADVQDVAQEMTMSQDKSFAGIIDKGETVDQCINKAGEWLNAEISEQVIPMMDKYKLEQLAAHAGTVNGTATLLKSTNIINRMAQARKTLLDARVPLAGRTWFVTTDVFNFLVDSDQFKNLAALGDKAVINGQVGELFGAPVVEVPADTMPTSVNFILVHKDAACAPVKIADTKVHIDPPGISGNLVEGRYYYDCFVFDAKNKGVYVDKVTSG